MEKSIINYLEKTIKKYGNKKAFIENEDKFITYNDFGKKAKIVASYILKNYDLKNKPIAIYIDKSIDALISMFGVLYSGNFYCIFDTLSPKNRLDNIESTLNPKLILTNSKNYNKIKEYNYKIDIINIDDIRVKVDDKLLSKVEETRCDKDVAYALFTSGSTGIPKGSIITHSSLISYTKWFKETFDINSRTIFGNQTPFYFSMSVSDIYSTIMSGASFCIIPKINFSFPVKLMEYLNKHKINTIYWVPSALSIVANLGTFNYVKPKYLKRVLFEEYFKRVFYKSIIRNKCYLFCMSICECEIDYKSKICIQ